MNNLLQYEFRKLVHSKSPYICTASVILCEWLTVLLQKLLLVLTEKVGTGIPLPDMMLPSKQVGILAAVIDGSLTTMLGIATALLVCYDYTSKTVRNVVSAGYDKASVFIAKWIASSVMAISMWIVTVASGILCAVTFNLKDETMSLFPIRLLVQLFAILAFAGIYTFVSVKSRKTATALIINLIIPLAGSFIAAAVSLLAQFGGLKHPELASYWFPDTILTLIQGENIGIGILLGCAAAMLAYIGIMLWLGVRTAKKSEI